MKAKKQQQKKNIRIHGVHLYNDFSGSPLIFSTVIEGLQREGFDCEIYTSGGQEGFLSTLNIPRHYFYYPWLPNRFLRLLVFLYSQVYLFVKLIARRKEIDLIYINTLLPFGAALAGRFLGKPVVYHLHEVSVKPVILKKILRWIAGRTAARVIFVSKYLAQEEAFPGIEKKVIANALSERFKYKVFRKMPIEKNFDHFRITMLCSLKKYKGVDEFVALANALPHRIFELVLNADQAEIDRYFKKIKLPSNLFLYPRQSDVHPFYQRAHLLLNLSHPEEWIETFGMTLLEAMSYGLPCIAPPIGGPAEIIDQGQEGFLIDQRDRETLLKAIELLATDPSLYNAFARRAQQKAQTYSTSNLIGEVQNLLENILDREVQQVQV